MFMAMLKRVVRLKFVYNFWYRAIVTRNRSTEIVFFPLRYGVSGCHLLDAYDIRAQLLESKNVTLERCVHREIKIIYLPGPSLRYKVKWRR
jgi:hypothetical protein